MLKTISPEDAARLIEEGDAMLVDVREPQEHARARIPGALSLPLSRLDRDDIPTRPGRPVLFHCRSGARTDAHARRLAAKVGTVEAYAVAGGIEAWKRAGLPIAEDRGQPIEMMRQVQITAGAMILAGLMLGAFVHPWFIGLSAFVGAGLVFSGVTGTCGMAHLLGLMPWNRRATAA